MHRHKQKKSEESGFQFDPNDPGHVIAGGVLLLLVVKFVVSCLLGLSPAEQKVANDSYLIFVISVVIGAGMLLHHSTFAEQTARSAEAYLGNAVVSVIVGVVIAFLWYVAKTAMMSVQTNANSMFGM